MFGLYAKLISGGVSLLLQILLVVGAVLLFMFIDPFGITVVEKKKLRDTPVQVESIKKLGELITAEYYGEVVASLDEVIDTIEQTQVDSFVQITDDLHREFQMAMRDLASIPDLKRKDRYYTTFREEFPEVVNHPHYPAYIYYIFEKLKDKNYKRRDLDKTLSERLEKKLIRRLYNNTGKWRETLLSDIETNDFKTVFNEQVKRTNRKTFRKSRLAMIGRGWVKAGFDFDEFDEHNFRYDEKQKVIHFIGFQPKIISHSINPWFIPQQGVEGFEFLIAERGVRMKPELTKMVKQRCMDKLWAQANDKDILQHAVDNAETYLRSFFSLVLEEEVKKVIFHTDPLEYALETVLMDSVIRNEELLLIDSVILAYDRLHDGSSNSRQRIARFIDTISQYGTRILDIPVALHPRTSTLFRLVEDKRISSEDSIWFANALTSRPIDRLWYSRRFLWTDTVMERKHQQRRAFWKPALMKDTALVNRIQKEVEDSVAQLLNGMVGSDTRFQQWLDTLLLRRNGIGLDTFNHPPDTVPDDRLRSDPALYFLNGVANP